MRGSGNRYDNVEDFTVDFELKNDGETTRMDVSERFTMIFPEANLQHGPIRELPYTNRAGKNLITEKAGQLDLKVAMDGQSFPVAQVEDGFAGRDKTLIHYIGRASSYLHGEHEFLLSYHYVNVISTSDSMQELYWNANGTGWNQTFSKVTARLHIADEKALAAVMKDRLSCYVGAYGVTNETGENISSRCKVTELEDGYVFSATDLDYGEGLTFAVDFQPGTFAAPQPKDDYLVLMAGILGCVLMLGVMAIMIKSTLKKVGTKAKLYKSTFVKPEYEPPRDLTVAEGKLLSTKKLKESYAATLMELAVSKKVKIIKGEPTKILKRDTWLVDVITTDDLTESQNDVLKLLAGKKQINVGEQIEIKRRTATRSMAKIAQDYSDEAKVMLRKKGLMTKSSYRSGTASVIIVSVFLYLIFGLLAMFFMTATITSYVDSTINNVVGADVMIVALGTGLILTWIIVTVCAVYRDKYGIYTDEGVRAARELEGLELYIKMAEADRLKFLQSVKGADVSQDGVVKLYEKLLPWAMIFGHEESWMQELGKYYQTIGNPEWCDSVDMLDVAVFSSVTRSVTTSAISTSSYVSSSGGSSSSFGGGGGGFSGGGGGGGGGGRW